MDRETYIDTYLRTLAEGLRIKGLNLSLCLYVHIHKIRGVTYYMAQWTSQLLCPPSLRKQDCLTILNFKNTVVPQLWFSKLETVQLVSGTTFLGILSACERCNKAALAGRLE